jgi:monovalent cation:H+ antiporter, CPA1 family
LTAKRKKILLSLGVGAGLVMGSYGRRTGMSERTRDAAHIVWEFAGYLANSFLFLLLGVQIGAASFAQALPGILWALVAVVVGRALIIYTLLRGALSIALVLSLPAVLAQRDLLEGIVYGVVLVTLLGQGIGLRFLLPRWPKAEEAS